MSKRLLIGYKVPSRKVVAETGTPSLVTHESTVQRSATSCAGIWKGSASAFGSMRLPFTPGKSQALQMDKGLPPLRLTRGVDSIHAA